MSKQTSSLKFLSGIRWNRLIVIPAVLLIGISTGCRVEQEEAGELPDVDVDVDAGKLPEVEVEGPEVEIGTEEKTIEVPTIDVDPPVDEEPNN